MFRLKISAFLFCFISRIIGPKCLSYVFERNEAEILHSGYPMLTLGMKNVVLTLSGFRDRAIIVSGCIFNSSN